MYRGLGQVTELEVEFRQHNVQTVKDALDLCFKKYAKKNALGTRKIIEELDEVQKNGKVFKKVS